VIYAALNSKKAWQTGTVGKGCVVSIDANKNIRLRTRDIDEISGSLINAAYAQGEEAEGLCIEILSVNTTAKTRTLACEKFDVTYSASMV